jgi:hypothetical protein
MGVFATNVKYISSELGSFIEKTTGRTVNYVTHRFQEEDGTNIRLSDPVRGRDPQSLLVQFKGGDQRYDLLLSHYELDSKTYSAKAKLLVATALHPVTK